MRFSKTEGGWQPCPSGDIITPFGVFPDPAPGHQRRYRLKTVHFDENAAGDNHVKVKFEMFSGKTVPVFTLPCCKSGDGASNFRYSDWFMFGSGSGEETDKSHAHCFACFESQAPYDNHAGIFSLVLEAHDIPT